jgi:hypothetical protein
MACALLALSRLRISGDDSSGAHCFRATSFSSPVTRRQPGSGPKPLAAASAASLPEIHLASVPEPIP